jgi:cytochrome d ubiquinol oxidase subunit II
MMSTLDTVWAANQTWLVVLGGMLFGAFPFFYGVVLTTLYIPLAFILVGLIFRGISFEFRARSDRKEPWSLAFGLGSLTAALAQGFSLGGLLWGLPDAGGRFAGGSWGWLSPFSALVAVGVASGYSLLGAAYLIVKTGGEVQEGSYRHALGASVLTAVSGGGVFVALTARFPHMASKWTTPPASWIMPVFPLLSALSLGLLWMNLARRRERGIFLWSAAAILFAFVGVSVGLYPYMIPMGATVEQAAASPGTLEFMLAVMGVIIPLTLGYNTFQYRVFRGKIEAGEGAYGGETSKPPGGPTTPMEGSTP